MSLETILEGVDRPACTLAVVGDEAPAALGSILESAFEDQPVAVDAEGIEAEAVGVDGDEADRVLLLEDDETVAVSPLSAVYDAFLAINSDLFVTGARDLEGIEVPAVLDALDDRRFTLRGYPLASHEKLLLIVLSRRIERLALEADGGTLRSGFQHLSRIGDEAGTERVYRRLSGTDVDVHVYGTPSEDPPAFESDLAVHAGTDAAYRRWWFVVFRSDDAADVTHAALLAREVEPRIWDGFWTYDPERVEAIDDAITAAL